MRYSLRALLIVLAILPPLLWGGYVAGQRYLAWRERERNQAKSVPVYVVPIGTPAPAMPFPPEMDYQSPPPSHFQLREPIHDSSPGR
jgi:hypothetical protein